MGARLRDPPRLPAILLLLACTCTALPAPRPDAPDDAPSDANQYVNLDEQPVSACSTASVRLSSALKGVSIMRAATGIKFVPCGGDGACLHMVQCVSADPNKYECVRLRRCTYNPLFPLRKCLSITPCAHAPTPAPHTTRARPESTMHSAERDTTTIAPTPAAIAVAPDEADVSAVEEPPCDEDAVHLQRANEGVVLRRTKGKGITYRACGNHTHCFQRVECVGELTMADGSVVKRECFVEHPCRDHSSKMPRCHLEVPCEQAPPDGADVLSPIKVTSPDETHGDETHSETHGDAIESFSSTTVSALLPCGDAGIKLRRAARGFTLKRAWGPGVQYQPCKMGDDTCLMSVDCDGSQTPASPLEDGGGLLHDAQGHPRCLEKEDCQSTPTSLECMQEVECEESDDDPRSYHPMGMHPSPNHPTPALPHAVLDGDYGDGQTAPHDAPKGRPLPVQYPPVAPHGQHDGPMQCDVGAVQLARAESGFWFAPAKGGLRLVPCRTGGNSLCVQMLPCQSEDDNLTCLQRVPCDGSGTQICLTTTPCPM